jgi:hypothetical protein
MINGKSFVASKISIEGDGMIMAASTIVCSTLEL